MFNNISWSEYLTFIFVSLLIWYAGVLITYYKRDLLHAVRNRQSNSPNALNFTGVSETASALPKDNRDYLPKPINAIIESFTDEVQAYLEEAGQNKTSKENILQSLFLIAVKYSSLAESEYIDSVNQFIISQAETTCAVFLSEQEIESIWNRT